MPVQVAPRGRGRVGALGVLDRRELLLAPHLDGDGAPGRRQGVEEEGLELDRVRLAGLDRPAVGVDVRHGLDGPVEGQPQPALGELAREGHLEAVHGDRAGPVGEPPSSSRCCASSSGRSLYSTTPVCPSIRAITPILSSGPSLRTTIDDMSAPAATWWPDEPGPQTDSSGLSTWNVKIVSAPSAAISSSAPEARSADSSPPWPSGESASRSGASSRIDPVARGRRPAACPGRRTAPTGVEPEVAGLGEERRAWRRRSAARSARTRAAARRSARARRRSWRRGAANSVVPRDRR